MRPAAKYGITSRSNAWMIAVFSATGRGRSTEPKMLKRFDEHAADVELGLAAAHDADHGEPAADGERAHVLREIRAAQVVEDHVDAALVRVALHGVGEVLVLVVDDDVGAERFDALDLARRRRHEDSRARGQRFHDLHRGRRDAAAAAVQQHRLAVGEARVEEQVHVRRQVRLADARRLLEAQVRRDAHDVARVRDGELGIPAAAEQREHALAAREARDAGADRLDGAGGLEARGSATRRAAADSGLGAG